MSHIQEESKDVDKKDSPGQDNGNKKEEVKRPPHFFLRAIFDTLG